MCISTPEALYMIKKLITCDVDECCVASMDKEKVIEQLEKIKKYLEKVNNKENPVDLNSPLDGYY
jgi:hypothetical protein